MGHLELRPFAWATVGAPIPPAATAAAIMAALAAVLILMVDHAPPVTSHSVRPPPAMPRHTPLFVLGEDRSRPARLAFLS